MTLKSDLIEGAYSKLRISGITVRPTPEDEALALRRLENMAAEFFGRSVNVGYYFEDDPDPATPHNIERKYWDAFESCLAVRLCPDFGKDPTMILLMASQSGYSFLSSDTALIREIPYPNRMPVGRGNERYRFPDKRYTSAINKVPLEPESNYMNIGDIDDYVERFGAYLVDGETISSYTIEADTGLTIVSSSNDSPNINYQISAAGTGEGSIGLLRVRIVITTSDARIETRIINFELTDTEL